MKLVVYFWELIRLLVPFLIFSNPLLASVLAVFFDEPDYILFYKAGYRWKIYNFVDKMMDYWWYIFITFYSLHLPIVSTILVLFFTAIPQES